MQEIREGDQVKVNVVARDGAVEICRPLADRPAAAEFLRGRFSAGVDQRHFLAGDVPQALEIELRHKPRAQNANADNFSCQCSTTAKSDRLELPLKRVISQRRKSRQRLKAPLFSHGSEG